DRADAPFQVGITGALGLQVRRDGVDVLGGGRERHDRAGAAGQLDHVLQQAMGALWAVTVDDSLERFDPFPGLDRVRIALEDFVAPVHITPVAARERGDIVSYGPRSLAQRRALLPRREAGRARRRAMSTRPGAGAGSCTRNRRDGFSSYLCRGPLQRASAAGRCRGLLSPCAPRPVAGGSARPPRRWRSCSGSGAGWHWW